MIQKKTGKPTDEWADDVFFSKLGLTNYNWIRYKDGISMGGYGIETTPGELTKIDLCVTNKGIYNGTQIVSSDWIETMTAPQIHIEDSAYSFGYFSWINQEKTSILCGVLADSLPL